jgi:hypothetical protein
VQIGPLANPLISPFAERSGVFAQLSWEMGSGDKKEMEMSVVRNLFPFVRLTPFP